jgi:hypothetical protein
VTPADKADYTEAGAFMNQIAEPGIQRAHASHQAECSRARPLAAGQTARPVIQAPGSVGAARDLGNDERRRIPAAPDRTTHERVRSVALPGRDGAGVPGGASQGQSPARGAPRSGAALTGEMVLGPPKSRAGWRIVGIPDVIIPALREHLAAFVKDEPGGLVFPGQMGGPLRRGNFNKMSGWPHAVRAIGMEGLHFHDLRHAGNHLAAASGAGLKDLMAWMGHDRERAALIYEHQARGADGRITDAIDVHVQAEHGKGDDEDGAAGTLVPAG